MQTALTKRIGDDPAKLRKLADFVIDRHTAYLASMHEWHAKRAKYQKLFDGDLGDRDTASASSIYSKENQSLEFITGMTEFMIARASDDVFGSEPFHAVIPVGQADNRLAQQMTLHSGLKLGQARFKNAGREAIRKGFSLGEGILKSTWKHEADFSDRLATVMMTKRGGMEVTTEDGEFIFDTDCMFEDSELGLALWSKSPILAMPEGATFKLLVDQAPSPILVDEHDQPILSAEQELYFDTDVRLQVADPARAYLSKAEIIAQGPDNVFEERLVEETRVLYDGLCVGTVNHMDFVAPLNVPALDDADYVGMAVGIRLSKLIADYDLSDETIQRLRSDNRSPKSEANKPIAHLGEGASNLSAFDDHDPEILCFEGFARYDIFEDYRPRRMFCVVAKEQRIVLFADYQQNVIPGGKLCYSPVVPCPVPGRWWGRGYLEIYELENDFIDRTFSGMVYRNHMHVSPMKLIQRHMLTESDAKKNITITPDGTLDVKKDFDAKDFITFIKFDSLDEMSWKMTELVMQMAQIRSGVSSAAAGSMTNMPGMETATGTQSIMMSGSTLHKLPIENCKDGLEAALLVCVMTLYAHQDKDETFAITEGQDDQLVTLTADSVRGLELNVRLLLTRLHEKEALDQATAAWKIVMDYLLNVPETEKENLRILALQALKALRITGAETILRHALPPQPPGPDQSIKESMNYKDAPDDIRRQMEQRAGFVPSTMAREEEEGAAETKMEGGKEEPAPKTGPDEPPPANATP